MEDKATLEDISDSNCTFNDTPRAKELKENIGLLRKKTKENRDKIKCIQARIRRILYKQRKNQVKAFTFLKDHGIKRERSSDDDDDDRESSESVSSPPPSEHIPMIDFDSKEHGGVKYELMEYDNIDAGLSTGSPDIGLEAVLEDIKAEPEGDPLALIGKHNGTDEYIN